MLLKDLLSKDVVTELQKMNKKDKKFKKKRNTRKKIKDNSKKKSKIKNSNNSTKFNNSYKVEEYYIEKCPYCASRDLSITGNGYYYCDNCGIKVEKK